MMPDVVRSAVVGVSFAPGYPENLYRLEEAYGLRVIHDEDPLTALLIRSPKNEKDPNAIEVHVPGIGMIGHLPAALAARLAPEIDDHQKWAGEVLRVNTHPDHPNHPGIQVKLRRIKEMASA